MGKTALVTGGAGGIAREIAPLLIERGFRLLLVDIDEERLRECSQKCGADALPVTADLTRSADLERVCDLIGATPELDLLINNAGIIHPGDVVNLPYAVLEQHIAVNLLAPMRLTQAAAAVMAVRGSGCILSIVSAAGVVALPGSAAYSASKFGLRGFLTALSQEMAPRGVAVRSVFPGAVDTPMLKHEATHGGSPLNFLNRDVLNPADVAAACMRAMDGTALETHLPFWDGVTSRFVGTFPGLMPRMLPLFQKQGEAGMKRYLTSRGLTPAKPDDPA